jgi:hypothetical protein
MSARHLSLWTALLLAAPASTLIAQTGTIPPFTCAPSAKAVPVRAEGTTELVADVVISCTGGIPFISDGPPITPTDIQLTFNANVTSRIIGAAGASESLLLLDEPKPGAQFPCDSRTGVCAGIGNGLGTGYYGNGPQTLTAPNNRNMFQGLVNAVTQLTKGSPQTITWPSVPVDPPGQGTRTFRFTNLRLDATSVSSGPLMVSTIRFTTANAPIPLLAANLPIVVAVPQASLVATVRDAASASVASLGVSVPVSLNGATLTRYATLRFAGTFGGADKPRTTAAFINPDVSPAPATQNVPGAAFTSESGFFNPGLGTFGPGGNLGAAGLADAGTRYMAVFSGIPAGFNLYVDLYNSTAASGPTGRLVSTDSNGAGSFVPTIGNGLIAVLPVNGGTAVATWEVLRGGGAADQFDFGVYLAYAAGITTLPPAAGVQMRYAPFPQAASFPLFSGVANTQPLFSFVQPPGVVVAPGALLYSGTAGGRNPASQSLSLVSTVATVPVNFNLISTGSLPIQFQSSSGVTPATIGVTLNTQGMSAGTYRDTITAIAANGSGRTAIPVTLTLNSPPQISSISPPTILVGPTDVTITLNGTNFFPGTVVQWNGTPLSTTFVSLAQLTAQVPASLIAAPNVATVTVVTQDGAQSNSVSVPVGTFTIASINPSTVTAGSPGFNLTITGTGFVSGDGVNVGGSIIQVASVTPTQIVVTIPPNMIAQAGSLPVTVVGPTGLQTNSVNLTVAPLFRLDTISPSEVTATAVSFPLTISGVGFVTGASVKVGSTTLQPASQNGTQITVAVPASLIAGPGSLAVTVTNPGPVVSNALSLTVNPVPGLTGLSPTAGTAGSGAVTLTITGTNLPTGALVQWNRQSLTTTVVSATQITASVPASLMATAGQASITVVTTDSVSSNALTFTVNPAPAITALGPSSASLGGAAFNLTVTGTSLTSGSVVKWNGQNLNTTFVSSTQLTAQVPAGLLASAGNATVGVTTADGVSSNTLRFTINLPPLTGVSVTAPASTSSGQDQNITVTLGVYPVDLVGTVTLTFAGDGGLPDDLAIQFQNQSRVFTFTTPAGTQPAPPQLVVKTGTVAGVITLTTSFTAGGVDVTPPGIVPQRIQVGRAAPSLSSATCTRDTSTITMVIDGFTNTREATQGTFDFQAASGATLGTSELVATVTPLFSAFFGGTSGAGAGGVFRYIQGFTVQGSSTSIASLSVKLGNSAGTSSAVSCRLP